MAAASVRPAQRDLDTSKPSKYPVRLASCILEERKPDSRFFTTRFNHKPSQIGPRRLTTITQTGDAYNLTIRDGEADEISKVSYTGHRAEQKQDTDAYVLIFDREQQSFTLNPVDGDYNFNISSTPWESNAETLARDYKQIPKESSLEHGAASPGHAHSGTDDDEDLFGEHAGEPDKANPFDFRHFLDAPPASPAIAASRAPSAVTTPLRLASSPVLPSSGAFSKASPMTKHKASPLMQPNRHRRNISTSSLGPGRAAAGSSKAKSKAAEPEEKPAQPVPRVQLERKASIKPNAPKPRQKQKQKQKQNTQTAPEDDDILIIEGEEDEPEERAYTPALRGTPNGGAPVSLSQLATSTSPAGFDRPDDDDEDEIVIGEPDDDDNDVQSISLGTPAHRHDSASSERRHLGVPGLRQQPSEENDPEDDQVVLALEAELLSGLESEDEDGDGDEDEGAASQTLAGTATTLPPSSLRQVQAEESDESEEE